MLSLNPKQDASYLHYKPFLALASNVNKKVIITSSSSLSKNSLIELFKSVIFALYKEFNISTKAYITIDKISYYYKVKVCL